MALAGQSSAAAAAAAAAASFQQYETAAPAFQAQGKENVLLLLFQSLILSLIFNIDVFDSIYDII